MSLPLKAIDRLFERLSHTYGSEWTARWASNDANAVKSVWSHELAAYEHNLEAIAWALENLPPRAPNVIEFRNICRAAPRKAEAVPAIEHVKADPAKVAAELGKLRDMLKSKAYETDHKAWARRLLARKEGGERIPPCHITMAKAALRNVAE